MQRMRDWHEIRFPAQGDGRAMRDRRQELLRHVVYNLLPAVVPAEDAAEEVAQLALVVNRDALMDECARIESITRQWESRVGVSRSHRRHLVMKHRIRY